MLGLRGASQARGDVEPHADESARPDRRRRFRLHLFDERCGARGQLDGPVQVRRASPATVHQRCGRQSFRHSNSGFEDGGVSADGQDVHPVQCREDPDRDSGNLRRDREASGRRAYTIFAQSIDRRYEAGTFTRTVDVHVASLRQKLEKDPKRPELIVTVHKSGYRFSDGGSF